MKHNTRTHISAAATAAAFTMLPFAHAGEGVSEADAMTIGDLFTSGQGTSEYLTLRSTLPAYYYYYSKPNWELSKTNITNYYLDATIGYSGNINYEPYQPNSSSFYQLGLGIQGAWNSGNTSINYEIGATGTRYNDGIYRDGHDKSMYDFSGAARIRHEFDESTVLYNHTYLHYGAHLGLSDNVVWPGVQQYDVFNWRSNTQLAWRTDGQAEHNTGIQHRTSLFYGGINQINDSWYDSSRIRLSHEVNVITEPGHGWFARGDFGIANYSEIDQYDSDSYKIGAGRFGRLPCGAHYRVGVGLQRYEYDGSMLDDRDELSFDAQIYGTLAKVDYRLYVNHGIQNDYDIFSKGNFIDPKGTKAGVSLAFQASDRIRVGTNFTGRHLKSDASSYSSSEISHYSLGATLTYDASESLQINVNTGVNRVSFDSGGSSSTDTFGTFTVSARYQF